MSTKFLKINNLKLSILMFSFFAAQGSVLLGSLSKGRLLGTTKASLPPVTNALQRSMQPVAQPVAQPAYQQPSLQPYISDAVGVQFGYPSPDQAYQQLFKDAEYRGWRAHEKYQDKQRRDWYRAKIIKTAKYIVGICGTIMAVKKAQELVPPAYIDRIIEKSKIPGTLSHRIAQVLKEKNWSELERLMHAEMDAWSQELLKAAQAPDSISTIVALQNVIAQGGSSVYFFSAVGILVKHSVQAGIVANDAEALVFQKTAGIYMYFIIATWLSKTMLAASGNDQEIVKMFLKRDNGYDPLKDALFVHDPKMLAFYLKVVSQVDDDTYKANLSGRLINDMRVDLLISDIRAEQKSADELRDKLARDSADSAPTIEWLADQKMQGEQESQKEIDMNSPEMLELLRSTVADLVENVAPSKATLKKPMSKADQEMLNMLINFGKHVPSDVSSDKKQDRANDLLPFLADNDRLMQKVERYFGVKTKD